MNGLALLKNLAKMRRDVPLFSFVQQRQYTLLPKMAGVNA